MNLDLNSTLLEFTDYYEEFIDCISCPICNEYPFKDGSIAVHKYVDLVFFEDGRKEIE